MCLYGSEERDARLCTVVWGRDGALIMAKTKFKVGCISIELVEAGVVLMSLSMATSKSNR